MSPRGSVLAKIRQARTFVSTTLSCVWDQARCGSSGNSEGRWMDNRKEGGSNSSKGKQTQERIGRLSTSFLVTE